MQRLGEAEKLVPVSPQRIASFDALSSPAGSAGGGVTLVLLGPEAEVVSIMLADHSSKVSAATCTIGRSGRVQMNVTADASGTVSVQCAEASVCTLC